MRRALLVLGLLGCHRAVTDAPHDASPPPEPTATSASATASPTATPTPVPTPSASATARHPAAILREEATVVVDGKPERWRLEWTSVPTPECMDDRAFTCPCGGREYGEEGGLDLVREREGVPAERLHLDALYMGSTPALPRWQFLAADVDHPPTVAEIQKRPVVKIMKLGDYDHDGQATELVLRVGYEVCGHWPTLVVGVSKANPKLHAFTTVESPKEPFTLEGPGQWETVRAALPATLTRIQCGDHGSDVEQTTVVTQDAAGLHEKNSKKPCP